MSRDILDNDAVRRALELSESPTHKVIRQMENGSVAQAARSIEILSAARALKTLEQTDLQRLMTTAAEAQKIFDACAKSQDWAEVSRVIAQAHSGLMRPEAVAAFQSIGKNLKDLVTATNHAIVPLAEQIQSFSLAAAQAVQPLQDQFERMGAWQTSLADRMMGLQTPWAIEDHLGVSIVGFARIARLHDVSSGPAPFHPASGEVFEEELGAPVEFDENQTNKDRETARIDAGLNPEVVAFPPAAYPSVLISAGFELHIEAITPVRSENGDATGRFDPQHASLLSQIENRLRALIETELRTLEGDSWLRTRIHGDLRKKWQERKTKDHDQRRDSYPLLFYADFMDLADIICTRPNWDNAFCRFFVSKQDFQVSMQRLSTVRNAIGHNRPLVRADQITLLGEGYRILNALGIRM
jgi:hypothetical protein